MDYETIILRKEDGVAVIALNRPDKLNALSPVMGAELLSAAEEISQDDTIRAVIITGTGRGFCSGVDMECLPVGDAAGTTRQLRRANQLMLTLRRMPKPVIAAVNGPAVGIGCNLALCCDVIMASDKASFGEVFVLRGLHPDGGGTYFLPRLVGEAKACELIFTGRIIDSKEAERIGMINQVVSAESLQTTVMDLARNLTKLSPVAIGLAKISIHDGMQMDLPSVLEAETRAQTILSHSDDVQDRRREFLERKKDSK